MEPRENDAFARLLRLHKWGNSSAFMWRIPSSFVLPVALLLFSPASLRCSLQPNVRDIIQRSVVANQADFKASAEFNHKKLIRTSSGTKTYQITMIDGSPYQRLILLNGNPLSDAQEADERKKQEQARSERQSQSDQERRERIAKFEKDRTRNHKMMEQLTAAFDFSLLGQSKMHGFNVWMLKATPRPGYHPPNMETQVLPGMEGELWIDQQTSQWVKVTARVIHPVSIEGFLAQVEPGTQFELEKEPVTGDVWLPSHFAMKSEAKVLFMIGHSSQADETYFDYQRAGRKQ